jgi:hypothetical protein
MMRRAGMLLVAGLALLTWSVLAGSTPSGEPRIAVFFLDGVPYRAAVEAVELGGYEGWSEPKAILAPFPSMTNVSFTAMMLPLGLDTIPGYEIVHFDPERNKTTSGVFNYDENKAGWRDVTHIQARKKKTKAANYLKPRKTLWKLLQRVDDLVMETEEELVLAHISSTDIIAHWDSGDALTEVLLDLQPWFEELARRHEMVRGRPLHIILCSDHGNSTGEVLHSKGLHDLLEDAGLRVRDSLERPDDVVAPVYGVVNFGVLFTAPENAERAARAVSALEGVNAAAWISAPRTLAVINLEAEARVHWREGETGRRYRYEPLRGDPLRLNATVALMEALGLVDDEGFASERDWFLKSAFEEFPDAPRRLVESITGRYVHNPATVIYSLDPRHAMGSRGARIGAKIITGHLEGTHGGLDRSSSLGIYLTNMPDRAPAGAVLRVDDVLRNLQPYTPLRQIPWED